MVDPQLLIYAGEGWYGLDIAFSADTRTQVNSIVFYITRALGTRSVHFCRYLNGNTLLFYFLSTIYTHRDLVGRKKRQGVTV